MSQQVRVRLEPLGADFEVPEGASLEHALFNYGVEFPCGGAATCGGCRVRVLDGDARVTFADEDVLTDEELDAGWRLSCHMHAEGPLTLHVGQWETPVLAGFEPTGGGTREGYGVAVDLGTTTVVVQLVDLRTGNVKAVRTQLNPQAAYGADVMSRVQLGMADDRLTHMIRASVGAMVEEVACNRPLEDVVVVGNTVMHHLYGGLDPAPLAAVPFRPDSVDEYSVTCGRVRTRFVRCIGGFVGSDILAGIVATGMRASTGAITHVLVEDGRVRCKVIGGTEARGICGSGLVDAVAAGLNSGCILPNGRMQNPEFKLCGPVSLSQQDIRELQLAKGAVAAGLTMLLDAWGAKPSDVVRLNLAGAFGNYVDAFSAARIGLLPVCPSRIYASGNTALRGARMLLLNPDAARDVKVEHIELAAEPEFQERFAASLVFPRA